MIFTRVPHFLLRWTNDNRSLLLIQQILASSVRAVSFVPVFSSRENAGKSKTKQNRTEQNKRTHTRLCKSMSFAPWHHLSSSLNTRLNVAACPLPIGPYAHLIHPAPAFDCTLQKEKKEKKEMKSKVANVEYFRRCCGKLSCPS